MLKQTPILVSLTLAACPGTELLDCSGHTKDPNVATYTVRALDVVADIEVFDDNTPQSVVFTRTLAMAQAQDDSQAELLRPLAQTQAEYDQLRLLFYMLISNQITQSAWAPRTVTIRKDAGACGYSFQNGDGHELTMVSPSAPCDGVWTGTQRGGTLTAPDSTPERQAARYFQFLASEDAYATATAADISYGFVEHSRIGSFSARVRYLATGRLAPE